MNLETLKDAECFDRWREAIGTDSAIKALLEEFCANASTEAREIIWQGFLALLDDHEVNFSLHPWKEALLTALTSPLSGIRKQALSALCDIANRVSDDCNVAKGLARSLFDESLDVRQKAVYACANFASRQLCLAILESLDDTEIHDCAIDDPDRTYVWHALFALDEIIDRIVLGDDDLARPSETMDIVLTKLLAMRFHSKLDVWKIGDSLGDHIKGPHALRVLTKMFSSSDPTVRDSSVHGLGHIGGEQALKLIEAALSDTNVEVREEARRALAEASFLARKRRMTGTVFDLHYVLRRALTPDRYSQALQS